MFNFNIILLVRFSWFISRHLSSFSSGSFAAMIVRICIASSALSIAVIVVAMSLINGFKKEVTDKIYNFWGHITITDTELMSSYQPMPLVYDSVMINQLKGFKHSDIPGLQSSQTFDIIGNNADDSSGDPSPILKGIQSFIIFPGILKTDEDFEGIQLKGLSADYYPGFFKDYLIRGKIPDWSNDSLFGRSLIISEQTASRMKLDTGSLIDVLFIKDKTQVVRRLKVDGIYRTGLAEYDLKVAFTHADLLRQLLNWEPDMNSGYELYLENENHLNGFLDYLFYEYLPYELLPLSIKSRFPAIFEWLDLQDYNQIVIISLMFAVCLINLLTTAMILIMERSHMVGLLKAIGAKSSSIRYIFVWLGIKILLWSIIIGNGIGLLLCFLQQKFKFIKLNEADYYLAYAPISTPWLSIFFINLIIVLATFVFLLIPGAYINKIDPIKVLRFR